MPSTAEMGQTQDSARQLPDLVKHLLVARMRVERGGQRTHRPRESLRQEEVPRGPVNVRDRRVAEGMEGIEAVEAGPDLPSPEGELDPAPRDPAAASLGTEEWVSGLETFSLTGLPVPESSKLTPQRVGQEHVSRPAALDEFGPEPNSGPWRAVRGVDIADVQAYDLGQTQASPEGQRIGEVVPGVPRRRTEDLLLLGLRQSLRAQVGHGSLLSVTIHACAWREVKVQVERAGTTCGPAELGPAAPGIAGRIAHGDGVRYDRVSELKAYTLLADQTLVLGAQP